MALWAWCAQLVCLRRLCDLRRNTPLEFRSMHLVMFASSCSRVCVGSFVFLDSSLSLLFSGAIFSWKVEVVTCALSRAVASQMCSFIVSRPNSSQSRRDHWFHVCQSHLSRILIFDDHEKVSTCEFQLAISSSERKRERDNLSEEYTIKQAM